jgi:Ca2+-binding EF-hand superfamily protein
MPTLVSQTPNAAAVFKALDKNGDGVVTLDEWVAAGRPEELFHLIDANHDGKLTLEELTAGSAVPLSRRQTK